MANTTAKEKKVPCGFCGKEFSIPSAITNKLMDENHICTVCKEGFAADASNCFGKQDQKTGKSLSADPNCKVCEYLKACAAWPKNSVVFIEPSEDKKGETKDMSTEKETPPTAKGKGKGTKAPAATKSAAPQASTKGKGTKPAVATKGKEKAPAAPKGELVEYAPNCAFRKDTSIEIACRILTAKKSIDLPTATEQFKKAGAESGNPEARVIRAAKYLKDAGVMTRESKNGVIIFTYTGKK